MSVAISRRALLCASAMVATSAAVWPLTRLGGGSITRFDLEAMVPRQFGQWQAIDDNAAILPNPEDEAAATAVYEHVVSRTYVRPDGAFVMFVLAHGRSDSGLLVLHRAEVCYAAQGFTVEPKGASKVPVKGGAAEATRMVATRDDRREQVSYWATVAGQQTDLGIAQKLRVLNARLHGGRLDAFLVRGSTISTNDGPAFSLVDEFLSEVINTLPPDLHSLVAGLA